MIKAVNRQPLAEEQLYAAVDERRRRRSMTS
jgi:hypothetical protein